MTEGGRQCGVRSGVNSTPCFVRSGAPWVRPLLITPYLHITIPSCPPYTTIANCSYHIKPYQIQKYSDRVYLYITIPPHPCIIPYKVLCTYTAKRRNILGCTSSTAKRFPNASENSRGQSLREITGAEGNLEVKEKSWGWRGCKAHRSRLKAAYNRHSIIISPSLHSVS